MSTASPAHLPPLGTHAREAVAGELQATLAELIRQRSRSSLGER